MDPPPPRQASMASALPQEEAPAMYAYPGGGEFMVDASLFFEFIFQKKRRRPPWTPHLWWRRPWQAPLPVVERLPWMPPPLAGRPWWTPPFLKQKKFNVNSKQKIARSFFYESATLSIVFVWSPKKFHEWPSSTALLDQFESPNAHFFKINVPDYFIFLLQISPFSA